MRRCGLQPLGWSCNVLQAMLQRMEARERERLADDERRHQLELEEQRKRKVCGGVEGGGGGGGGGCQRGGVATIITATAAE